MSGYRSRILLQPICFNYDVNTNDPDDNLIRENMDRDPDSERC